MHKNKVALFLFILLAQALPLSLYSQDTLAEGKPIVTTKVEGTFIEVSQSIRSAILGKGINIAHVLPASGMLHRTGPAFGYTEPVYLDAETFEFCSASISHKLARSNPDNIVLCPFTISVYVLREDPAHVRISYRVPQGIKGSEEAISEVVTLLQSIVEDATW